MVMLPSVQSALSFSSQSASSQSGRQQQGRFQDPPSTLRHLACAGTSVNHLREGGPRIAASRGTAGGKRCCGAARAIGDGDFGARNPRPAELESNFADKTLGDWDTEHKIKLPSKIREVNGLARLSCEPLPEGAAALPLEDCKALLRKVVGWKIVDVGGTQRLRGEWRVRSFPSGVQLFSRIGDVAEAAGHHPDLHLVAGQTTNATVDIWSHSVGGLTDNDFILAAKIDLVNMNDLISKKNRVWA